LENIIEHAVVLAESNEITERDLPDFMLRNRLLLEGPGRLGEPVAPASGAILTLKELERGHIERTLDLLDNNYSETAKKLGVSRSTLWRKIKDFKLEGHAAP
jgi:DNA-binding NtrC family response regulator